MSEIQSDFECLLFKSDEMSLEEIIERLGRLRVQKQRWLGSFHPDSQVRCKAFRASGVKIGTDVFISIGLVILDGYQQLVSIGDRAAFGNYVTLVAASAPNNSLLCKQPEVQQRYIKTLPIHIGNDAWIGSGAIILPGVTIGEEAIIGAGSVIDRDVLPHTVVAGVPGRLLRTLNPYSNPFEGGDDPH